MAETDFLVIGSGMAGLIFALKAAAYGKVTIITKKGSTEANTNYAQGGIAAVFSPEDSPELHIQDTLKAGAGLCREEVVKMMVREGPRLVNEIANFGVKFTRNECNRFDLGREGGHSKRRIVHAQDATGAEIESTLVKLAKSKGVEIFEDWLAVDLIVRNGECIGAWVLDVKQGKEIPFFSMRALLIASGGIGSIYLHTTNPSIATGDGIAMAYRAGAKIANMEFVQFHPTSFYGKKIGDRALLLSEAMRGEGGILRTQDGKAFMEKYDSRRELASRDIVARAIDKEMKERSEEYVFLDMTHLPADKLSQRFPNISNACLAFGIDIARAPIPVVPAAHYICGGVLVDVNGRTEIPGLYAAGEAACTGIHGANRLASNSLLESLVFAERAAQCAANERLSAKLSQEIAAKCHISKMRQGQRECDLEVISEYKLKIKRLMWHNVGIVRNDKDLRVAKNKALEYKTEIEGLYRDYRHTLPFVELRNMVTTALLVIECALLRKESRGLHFNLDYPETDDLHYKKDTIIGWQQGD